MTSSAEDKRNIDQALADWLTRLGGDDGADYQQSFERWLEQDPAHRAAYRAFRETDDEIGTTSLPVPPLRVPIVARSRPRLSDLALAGMAVLAVFGVGAVAMYRHAAGPTTGTEIVSADESRSVDLPGGPSMVLDAHSMIRTAFEGDRSTVLLEDGRARFRLADDMSAPFTVASGDLRISSRGGVFDVRKERDAVLVTALRGMTFVRHQRDLATKSAIRLTRGEQLRSDHSGDRIMAAPEDEARWTSALMPLDGMTIGEIVAIGNAHGGKPIRLADPTLAVRPLQGQLPATDTRTLSLQLAAAFDLDLSETEQALVLAPRK